MLKPGSKPTGQLREGKALVAVAKVVAPGQHVVRIEVVIDLADEAVHAVEEAVEAREIVALLDNQLFAGRLLSLPAIFGVGHGLRANNAVVTGLTESARSSNLASVAAITAGSGTQVVPACAPFSRWPS